MSKRKGWRQFYDVWQQAKGARHDGAEYAAECLTCTKEGKPQGRVTSWRGDRARWLCEHAGDRREAWLIAAEHEEKVHAESAT